jgi:hypothetical protein
MFSQTFEELLGELEGFDYEIFWAHGRPLPDCFNEPTEEALSDSSVFAVLYLRRRHDYPQRHLKKDV